MSWDEPFDQSPRSVPPQRRPEMIDFYLERGQNALVQRELALSDLLIAADRGDEEGVRVWADAYGLWQNTLRYCSRRASQYHELIQEEDW